MLTWNDSPPTAAFVRLLRRHLGLTQADVAARSGVAESTISGIENGRLNPSVRQLDRIARLGFGRPLALGLDTDA